MRDGIHEGMHDEDSTGERTEELIDGERRSELDMFLFVPQKKKNMNMNASIDCYLSTTQFISLISLFP